MPSGSSRSITLFVYRRLGVHTLAPQAPNGGGKGVRTWIENQKVAGGSCSPAEVLFPRQRSDRGQYGRAQNAPASFPVKPGGLPWSADLLARRWVERRSSNGELGLRGFPSFRKLDSGTDYGRRAHTTASSSMKGRVVAWQAISWRWFHTGSVGGDPAGPVRIADFSPSSRVYQLQVAKALAIHKNEIDATLDGEVVPDFVGP